MTMSKQEFLQSAGIDTQTVEFWLEQQWLLPEPTPAGPSFSDREIARARFIVDLKSTFQANDEAIDVIITWWIRFMGCAMQLHSCAVASRGRVLSHRATGTDKLPQLFAPQDSVLFTARAVG